MPSTLLSPTNTNDQQNGPWWSRILTNRGAVIAAVALYLVYFITQNLTGGLASAEAVARDTQAVIINHSNMSDAAHNAQAEQLRKLVWEATLQTRLMREDCWRNAKNDEQKRVCYDSDVLIPGVVR